MEETNELTLVEKIVISIKNIVNNKETFIPELQLVYELEKNDFYNVLYTLGRNKKPFDFLLNDFFITFGEEHDLDQIKIKFIKK